MSFLLLFQTAYSNAQIQATSYENEIRSSKTVFSANSHITDTILNSDYLNFVTLIVDYDTYEFEGGNLSYYQHGIKLIRWR